MEKTVAAVMEVEAEAGKESLGDMPDLVFLDGLFPVLSQNQLLRIRRVNKKLNEFADEYLGSHPPTRKIVLREFSLSQFLQEDKNSKMSSSVIGLKCCEDYFCIDCEERWPQQIQSPEMNDFLVKYGSQIRFLKVPEFHLPMERDSPEFRFFQRITNLETLHTINVIVSPLDVDEDEDNEHDFVVPAPANAAAAACEELPNCFKNSLKQLKVGCLWFFRDRPGRDNILEGGYEYDVLCQLTVQLKKLDTFQYPKVVYQEFDPDLYSTSWNLLLENLNKIIKNKTNAIKAIKFSTEFDYIIGFASETKPAYISDFFSLCVSKKINCTNIGTYFLRDVEKCQIAPDQFTNCITSLRFYDYYHPGDLTFSNLEKLSINCRAFYIRERVNGYLMTLPLGIGKIEEIFSTARFPAVRVIILEVFRGNLEHNNKVLNSLWNTFVNLEELFIRCCSIGNEAFFGSDVGKPAAFLQLTKLKKLTLDVPPGVVSHGLTDAVFKHVFGQMKLKEFFLTSCDYRWRPQPIQGISKDAILSLLTGPFFESIEKFPFRKWALSDMSPEEFLELSKKFPDNQSM